MPEPEPVAQRAPESPPEPAVPEPAAQPAPVAAETAPEPATAEAAAEPPDNVTMMWDSLADINKVDWARGGFGVMDDAPMVTDLATVDGIVAQLIDAASIGETNVVRSPELIAKAGSLLRRLVSGLLVMVEARARAKAQMGAELTGLQLDGNNPIKFARTPEQALAQLLNPPESGFMDSERAVEDAYLDLQSHQVATLKAIPGALRATLDRFSPGSVRRRRGGELGGLAKYFAVFRDAALWRYYEQDYVAVKKESDEAFMEVFSREFRKAYERQLRDGLK
jgi:type VI secretion system FHA domain protein